MRQASVGVGMAVVKTEVKMSDRCIFIMPARAGALQAAWARS